LNVLFAAVEMSPLAKVGGLGDVAGSLPRALRARGEDVRVAMPMHGAIERTALRLTHLLSGVKVPWPDGDEHVDVWQADVRGVPVYLLEHKRYFGRPAVYGFDDDVERFLFYCDALLACAPHLGFRPDVVHAQDWHTAQILMRLEEHAEHVWAGAGRVYTIHNLALKGEFDGAFAQAHGIAPRLLMAPAGVAPSAAFSSMAQGIMHADRINTVSETYAREILTPEYGAGLDDLLRVRSAIVSGIVNGIDYEEFDPATDPAIVQHFTAESIGDRIKNKRVLQEQAGLPVGDETLLCASVTRLFAQKGIDLVAGAFDHLLASSDLQLIILGTGDEKVHDALAELEAKYPAKVKNWFAFDPPLGQRIYAGCDVFLMPSRYEPCGLGQMISLRYGAVPLVRHTGGLADTVQDVDASLQSGTGFVFEAASTDELAGAVERALAAHRDAAAWQALQERGMRQDWSWGRAAGRYVELYAAAAADRQAASEASRESA
jgi:starch synthase